MNGKRVDGDTCARAHAPPRRREALRFRSGMEDAQQRAADGAAEGAALRARLAALEADAAEMEAFTRKRCGGRDIRPCHRHGLLPAGVRVPGPGARKGGPG
jgi:hypothetical protein